MVVLTPHDSNVALCRLFCVLYMPLIGLVQARPWFRSSNHKVASKIAGSSFPISHLAFFISHFYLAFFISHLAFFISHFYLAFFISHFLSRIFYLAFSSRKFFSSPTKSHLECLLQASVQKAFQISRKKFHVIHTLNLIFLINKTH